MHVCFPAISIAPVLSYPSKIDAHLWRGTFIAALPLLHIGTSARVGLLWHCGVGWCQQVRIGHSLFLVADEWTCVGGRSLSSDKSCSFNVLPPFLFSCSEERSRSALRLWHQSDSAWLLVSDIALT